MQGDEILKSRALRLGKELDQKFFVRAVADHPDRLAGERRRIDLSRRKVLSRGEARRRQIVGAGEREFGAQRRRRPHRRDHRVALAGPQRIDERVPAPRLHGAGQMQLLADGAGDLDVEAGERAVGISEIERRIVVGGEEADRLQPRQVGLVEVQGRVPQARRRISARRAGAERQRAKDARQSPHAFAGQ